MQARSFRTLKKYFEECLTPYGLTSMQWFIAGTVYDHGEKGIAMTTLAKEMGITLPSLLGALEGLEAKGMVTKVNNSGDNRIKMIAATQRFIEHCPIIEESLRVKFRNTLYKNLSFDELTTFVQVMYKIANLEQ